MRIEHSTMGKQSALRIICALALATSGSVRAQSYSALDLGTLGGSYSTARGLGSVGQVWGYTSTAGNASYPPFLTGPNGTGMVDIASLGLTGSIVGMDTAGRLLLSDGSVTGPNGIGTTDLGGIKASAISDSGRVVGSTGGRIVVTGPGGVGVNDVAGIVSPSGVNDSGQVIGVPASSLFPPRAAVTGPNGIGITELALPFGGYGIAGSRALDINNAGQVVGYSPAMSSNQTVTHAFITGPNGAGTTDLNALVALEPGETLRVAWGINDAGQIVATSNNRAYLLSPVKAVPDPGIYLITLSGLALMGCRRRKILA